MTRTRLMTTLMAVLILVLTVFLYSTKGESKTPPGAENENPLTTEPAREDDDERPTEREAGVAGGPTPGGDTFAYRRNRRRNNSKDAYWSRRRLLRRRYRYPGHRRNYRKVHPLPPVKGHLMNESLEQEPQEDTTLGPRCASSPCLNNGTCGDIGYAFCFCPQGWTGTLCEKREPSKHCPDKWCRNYCKYGFLRDVHGCIMCECAPNPCKNHTCPVGERCVLDRKACRESVCPLTYAKCVPAVEERRCSGLAYCKKACRFGMRENGNGCPFCSCAQSPCKKAVCSENRACVVEKFPCVRRPCFQQRYRAVCRPMNKPGVCPTSSGNAARDADRALFLSLGEISVGDNCKIDCLTDTDCGGLTKCCYNGCGKRCMLPDLTGVSRCQIAREDALENNFTSYVPQCSEDGNFDEIQCKTLHGGGRQLCTCVDVTSGVPVRGAPVDKTRDINCTDVTPHLCTQKHCRSGMSCPFGRSLDENSCPTCQCAPNPCQGHICSEGKMCELIATSCRTPPCVPLPVCVDRSWVGNSCPRGRVLRQTNPPGPVVCDLTPCPQTHYCHTNATLPFRVCCPNVTEPPGGVGSRFRLAGGGVRHMGRLEYQTDSGAWGTVCLGPSPRSFHVFRRRAVGLICKDLGYVGPLGWGAVYAISRPAGPGQGRVALMNPLCRLNSARRLLCHSTEHCAHDRDVYVMCKAAIGQEKPGVCPARDSVNYFDLHSSSASRNRRNGHGWSKRNYVWCHFHGDCHDDADCHGVLKCCESTCGKKCFLPLLNQNSSCESGLRAALITIALRPSNMAYIPRCTLSGEWQRTQCHDMYGVCWCVHQDGTSVHRTMVRGVADCSQVCPRGEEVRICDRALCHGKTCPGDRNAICRINPCGRCRVEFYDARNHRVDCTAGLSACSEATWRANRKVLTTTFPKYRQIINRNLFVRELMEEMFKTSAGISSQGWAESVATRAKRENLAGEVEGDDEGEEEDSPEALGELDHVPEVRCPNASSLKGRDALCAEECSRDRTCGQGRACCWNGCGHVCLRPVDDYEVCSVTPEPSVDFPNSSFCGLFGKRQLRRWYFDVPTQTCKRYSNLPCTVAWAQPYWRSRNVFGTEYQCRRRCSDMYPMRGVFAPRCLPKEDGSQPSYSNTQCHDGMCWCVNNRGQPTEGTLTIGALECSNEGDIIWSAAPQAVCPGGGVPKVCHDACLLAHCHVQHWHSVHCFADPCQDCSVTFRTTSGDLANCSAVPPCNQPKYVGPCKEYETRWYYDRVSQTCQKFAYGGCKANDNNFETRSSCEISCAARLCPPTTEVSLCPDACTTADCARFPEAACTTDPCSCRPVFVDPDTAKVVHCEEERTLCERRRADRLREWLLTPGRDLEGRSDAVQCDTSGAFNPLQCGADLRVCWCVDDRGVTLNGSMVDVEVKGSVPQCEKVVTHKAAIQLIFAESFTTISRDVSGFAEATLEAVSKVMSFPKKFITGIQVSPGSIIVIFTVTRVGDVDLPSALDYLQLQVLTGEFSVQFGERNFRAVNTNCSVEHVNVLPQTSQHLVHTTNDDVHSTRLRYIIGGVVGAIGLVAMVVVTAMIFRVRRINKDKENVNSVHFSNNMYGTVEPPSVSVTGVSQSHTVA